MSNDIQNKSGICVRALALLPDNWMRVLDHLFNSHVAQGAAKSL